MKLSTAFLLAAAPFAAPPAFAAPAAAETPAFAPTRFSVVVEGEGPDVILIPGLATSRQVWERTRAGLAGRYRLHMVQLSGFGGSPAGANAEGPILPGLIDELSRYIAANRLVRPAVVGHSIGGFIGLSLAKAHPAQVGKLMIVDSLPFIGTLFDPAATAETIAPRAAMMRDAIAAQPASPGPRPAPPLMSRSAEGGALVGRWTAGADPRVVAQAMYEVTIGDLRPALPSIATPITMLYPWDEGTVTEAQAKALYEAAYRQAPNATLVAVGHSQHFIMIDQPERFHALLEDFLKK